MNSATLFYERITVLDYAFSDDVGIIGNSLLVNAYIKGQMDSEGIIFDFALAKNAIKNVIDREVDHQLVIQKSKIIKESDGRITVKYKGIEYTAPAEAICGVDSDVVDYDEIKKYLMAKIMKEMPKNVDSVDLDFVSESDDTNPFFQYTHGLKDHYGNCQRPFHGHRNILKVKVDGKARPDLAQRVIDEHIGGRVHFVFWDSVANKEEILKAIGEFEAGRHEAIDTVKTTHTSSQGVFDVEIPGKWTYLLGPESTVENLSLHFMTLVRGMVDDKAQVEVQAFEGIGKGAISHF